MTNFPVWKDIDEDMRARLVAGAARYITEGDPRTEEWLGNPEVDFFRPAVAGYRALRLLAKYRSNDLNVLPAETWKKWAPAIVCAYITSHEERKARQALVKRGFAHAQEEVIRALLVVIDRDNADQKTVYRLWLVDGCWNRSLAEALLGKAHDANLTAGSQGALLSALLAHHDGEIADVSAMAQEYAECIVQEFVANGSEPDRARMAVHALLNGAENAGWQTVWTLFEQCPSFAHELAASLGYRDRRGSKF